ncbi:H-type small acid-soluble spore protein [Paenibacillus sp. YYML68]|uniref:H-type small acid-soluble spore protein n=1 Tax=Paenibacillus sp. YYML68 TaxID=2909250 RepID=UPI002492FF45|nr:H-type small acid-soluble spore protein [Paenibacillus sp. YYML68]
MKVQRAQQILNATHKIEVDHNGVAVWIDSVNEEQSTAKVHAEDCPADMKTVSVEELQEVQ